MIEPIPPVVAALADAYKCGHCDSDPAIPWLDELGCWHLSIPHDNGCPVRRGIISDLPDVMRAAGADR